jgi:hypothetical protein
MRVNINILCTICSIIVILSTSVSCKNRKDQKNEGPVVAKELKFVEVPPMMTDPESRSKYASEHFWDDFDFNDSTYLINRKGMNEYMSTYFFILANTTQDVVEKSINSFITKFSQGDSTLSSYFMDAIEDALNDPNSEIRDESLYISFLRGLISSKYIDDIAKEKHSFKLELALKNRPGTISLDFSYIDNKNRVSSLHKTVGKYIFVFFYEPGCPSCNDIKQGVLESLVFKSFGNNLTYLAIYTGEDRDAWEESFTSFPPNWIVAHNIGQELANDNLYDLRASPTMYLLDATHRVLLKDPDLFQLNNYLSTLQY